MYKKTLVFFLILLVNYFLAQQNITVSPTSISATFDPNPSAPQSVTITKTSTSAVFPFGNYNLVYQSNIGSFTTFSGGTCLSGGGCNSVNFPAIINSMRTCPSSGTVRMTGAANTNTTLFSVTAPAPTLTAVSATAVGGGPPISGASYDLSITGNNFRSHSNCSASLVEIGTSTTNPTWINVLSGSVITTSSGVNTITINVSFVNSSIIGSGTKPVRVTTPGGVSSILNIVVNAPPVIPTVNSIVPNNTPTLVNPGIVVVNGSNFDPSTVNVRILSNTTTNIANSSLLSTGANSISFAWPASLINSPNVYDVSLRNGTGLYSAAVFFYVAPPSPTLISTSALYQTSTSMSITGTGFYSTPSTSIRSNVLFNTTTLNTTSVSSSTQLTLSFNTSLINGSTTSTPTISVVNNPLGGFGGGNSAGLPVPIIYSVPTITSLSQTAAPVGNGNVSLVINGSFFAATSTVDFDGTPLASAYSVANGQITCTIPASQFTTAKIATITVTNPSSGGGGGSSTASFRVGTFISNVTNASTDLPTMQTYTPSVNPLPTIAVTGAAFTTSSVIFVNGIDLNTTFVSSTLLRAVLDTNLDNSPAKFLLKQQMQQRGALRVNVKNGTYVSNTHAFPVFAPGDPAVFNKGTASMRILEHPFPGDSLIAIKFEGITPNVSLNAWISLLPPPNGIFNDPVVVANPIVSSWTGFYNVGNGQTILSPIGTLPGGEFLFQLPVQYNITGGAGFPFSINGFFPDPINPSKLASTWPGMFSF